MNSKLYKTSMTIAILVLGIAGIAFILVSILDENASRTFLTLGLLFVALGNVLNLIRMHRKEKAAK
ncbi:MAG: hypothetical protein IJL36_00755 [Clostridia bacterium]|jgi:hypothetical protein|nr:hypothetical protein [Clostridia bacterium]